ncbi:hypothetical protein KO561_09300 [Radiobacillus kanasensis]|uniref:hypothetical protein n=1 Tax=Radiobacillus kanasensis TaxID=2844358 RepID=UPI001E618301|nr:hypothetical protein [Radiobacillus kanasensis]UFU01108.1 hypothetical protein KO561_09300 [Radiobacillus kanasensis]
MLENYPQMNHQVPLPPGYYMYSTNFPSMMNQISPTYTIPTKPVYVDHLLMYLNKTIQVVNS